MNGKKSACIFSLLLNGFQGTRVQGINVASGTFDILVTSARQSESSNAASKCHFILSLSPPHSLTHSRLHPSSMQHPPSPAHPPTSRFSSHSSKWHEEFIMWPGRGKRHLKKYYKAPHKCNSLHQSHYGSINGQTFGGQGRHSLTKHSLTKHSVSKD